MNVEVTKLIMVHHQSNHKICKFLNKFCAKLQGAKDQCTEYGCVEFNNNPPPRPETWGALGALEGDKPPLEQDDQESRRSVDEEIYPGFGWEQMQFLTGETNRDQTGFKGWVRVKK